MRILNYFLMKLNLRLVHADKFANSHMPIQCLSSHDPSYPLFAVDTAAGLPAIPALSVESKLPECFRTGVYTIDRILRHCFNIREFCASEKCILRIACIRCRSGFTLNQNLTIAAGDVICDLHFWNEHLTQLLDTGLGLRKGVRLRKQLKESLQLLAQYAATDPKMSNVRAFHARTAFLLRERDERLESVARDYGFTVTKYSTSMPGKIHDLLETILIHALMWTFNPSYEIKMSEVRNPYRAHLWMSREELLRLYLQNYSNYSMTAPHEMNQTISLDNVTATMENSVLDTSVCQTFNISSSSSGEVYQSIAVPARMDG